MSDEVTPDEEKPVIANYYPELHDNSSDDFRVVTITYSPDVQSIMLAPRKWWSESEEKHKQLVERGCDLHHAAWNMIDPVKLDMLETRRGAASVLAAQLAGVVCLNLDFLLRNKIIAERGSETVTLMTLHENDCIIAASPEEATDLIWRDTLQHVIKKLEPEFTEEFAADTELIKRLWRHVIFRTLLEVEEHHGGVEKFQKDEISKAEFDLLFHQYLGSHRALLEASVFYAQGLARNFLETKNPSAWSIEELMEFLNLKYGSGLGFVFLTDLSLAQAKNLIDQTKKTKPLSVNAGYDIRGNKSILRIELEFDKAIDVKTMFAAVSKKRPLSARTKRKLEEAIEAYARKQTENGTLPEPFTVTKLAEHWPNPMKPTNLYKYIDKEYFEDIEISYDERCRELKNGESRS